MKSIVKSVGRPSKLTPQTIKILKATIGKGMSYADACTLSGISYSTFKKWQQKAEAGVKEYLFFLDELKKAKAMGKLQNIKKIREDSSWQSAAWLLERQYPEEFGRRENIKHTGEDGPITFLIKGV